MIIVVVYVDDIIFGGDKDIMCKDFAGQMKTEFKMSMLGELSYFLGLQISQKEKGIFISQTKYMKYTLKEFQKEDNKPVSTPMVTGCKLSKLDESPEVEKTLYRSMIGSLLYLTTSRPDIVQVVCMVARLQVAPKQSQLNAVWRIFRYLQGTITYGLWYPKKGKFTLQAYTNADWARIIDDQKSTSGGDFYLGDQLVSWHSKKQDSMSLSTAKVHSSYYLLFTSFMDEVDTERHTGGDIRTHSNPV